MAGEVRDDPGRVVFEEVTGGAGDEAGAAGLGGVQGFLRRRIPLTLRRAVTMTPALAVLALGLPPTGSLVVSQVVLSFGIPFALVPLLLVTGRRDVMGAFANGLLTKVTATAIAVPITGLNVYLIADTLGR